MDKSARVIFSVIIPTYNRSKYVVEAIESVRNQTYSQWEIIVVDDGSTDKTLEILKAYAGDISIVQTNRLGPGGARNAGASIAKGKYLSFLDSDDKWCPWTLQTIWNILVSENRELLIYLKPKYYRDGRDTLPGGAPECLDYAAYESYFDTPSNTAVGTTLIGAIPKCIFDSVGGFREEGYNAEDRDWAFRVGDRLPCVVIDSPTTHLYREHDTQVSLDHIKNLKGWRIIADSANKKIYGDWRSNSRLAAKLVDVMMVYAIFAPQRFGKFKDGLYFYRQALRFSSGMWATMRPRLFRRVDVSHYPLVKKSRAALMKFMFMYPFILVLTAASRLAHMWSERLISQCRDIMYG